jgi:two-component system sensor histidine kinase PrrB
MAVEHHRIVTLLEGLQTLARGDGGALPGHGPVELGELVDDAVVRAQRRHPDVTFLSNGVRDVVVDGWRAGLLLAVDNLLDNAAAHGRPDGTVTVSVSETGITVADDGPGIPADDREDMKRRFVRGPRPRSDGSGLGLALVEQQAQLHGGILELGEAPQGGLLAVLRIS